MDILLTKLPEELVNDAEAQTVLPLTKVVLSVGNTSKEIIKSESESGNTIHNFSKIFDEGVPLYDCADGACIGVITCPGTMCEAWLSRMPKYKGWIEFEFDENNECIKALWYNGLEDLKWK